MLIEEIEYQEMQVIPLAEEIELAVIDILNASGPDAALHLAAWMLANYDLALMFAAQGGDDFAALIADQIRSHTQHLVKALLDPVYLDELRQTVKPS